MYETRRARESHSASHLAPARPIGRLGQRRLGEIRKERGRWGWDGGRRLSLQCFAGWNQLNLLTKLNLKLVGLFRIR
jgi:hypothetical protein